MTITRSFDAPLSLVHRSDRKSSEKTPQVSSVARLSVKCLPSLQTRALISDRCFLCGISGATSVPGRCRRYSRGKKKKKNPSGEFRLLLTRTADCAADAVAFWENRVVFLFLCLVCSSLSLRLSQHLCDDFKPLWFITFEPRLRRSLKTRR